MLPGAVNTSNRQVPNEKNNCLTVSTLTATMTILFPQLVGCERNHSRAVEMLEKGCAMKGDVHPGAFNNPGLVYESA